MATPYVTPSVIANAPTGIAWSIIPEPGANPAATLAEQTNICWRATSVVDTYCNQVLRATVDNEELTGPFAPRAGFLPGTDVGRLVMRRWPVAQVLAIQTSPARCFPRTWTSVPAGYYEPEFPLINAYTDTASATAPDGGSSILVKPGYIERRYGRNGLRILVSYTNGWPHTSLTAASAVGAQTLSVDDVTGWAGASGFVYDGSTTEALGVVSVSADTPLSLPNGAGTAQTGPGTITLSGPLANAHAKGTLVSALPANVMQAAILACATQALESGIEAITIQNMPGSTTTGGHGIEALEAQYKEFLDPYRRIV